MLTTVVQEHRDHGFNGKCRLLTPYQTFGGEDLYPTVFERQQQLPKTNYQSSFY
jgi:hypothetical protein